MRAVRPMGIPEWRFGLTSSTLAALKQASSYEARILINPICGMKSARILLLLEWEGMGGRPPRWLLAVGHQQWLLAVGHQQFAGLRQSRPLQPPTSAQSPANTTSISSISSITVSSWASRDAGRGNKLGMQNWNWMKEGVECGAREAARVRWPIDLYRSSHQILVSITFVYPIYN